MANPLDQFTIQRYREIEVGTLDAAFTNASLFMLITLGVVFIFFWLGSRNAALIPGRWQAALESVSSFVTDIADENIGPKGRPFVPFIFALFIFVLIANLLGLLPYSFTVTSHIAVTGALAAMVFLLCVIVGVIRHGFRFFSLFVPANTPLPLLLLITPVEMISFLSRPLTLAIRLFANMTAGHILLKVFAGFIIALGTAGFMAPLALLPFGLTVAFYALELLVAVVQAYVFALLTAIYLNDSINLHH